MGVMSCASAKACLSRIVAWLPTSEPVIETSWATRSRGHIASRRRADPATAEIGTSGTHLAWPCLRRPLLAPCPDDGRPTTSPASAGCCSRRERPVPCAKPTWLPQPDAVARSCRAGRRRDRARCRGPRRPGQSAHRSRSRPAGRRGRTGRPLAVSAWARRVPCGHRSVIRRARLAGEMEIGVQVARQAHVMPASCADRGRLHAVAGGNRPSHACA